MALPILCTTHMKQYTGYMHMHRIYAYSVPQTTLKCRKKKKINKQNEHWNTHKCFHTANQHVTNSGGQNKKIQPHTNKGILPIRFIFPTSVCWTKFMKLGSWHKISLWSYFSSNIIKIVNVKIIGAKWTLHPVLGKMSYLYIGSYKKFNNEIRTDSFANLPKISITKNKKGGAMSIFNNFGEMKITIISFCPTIQK